MAPGATRLLLPGKVLEAGRNYMSDFRSICLILLGLSGWDAWVRRWILGGRQGALHAGAAGRHQENRYPGFDIFQYVVRRAGRSRELDCARSRSDVRGDRALANAPTEAHHARLAYALPAITKRRGKSALWRIPMRGVT